MSETPNNGELQSELNRQLVHSSVNGSPPPTGRWGRSRFYTPTVIRLWSTDHTESIEYATLSNTRHQPSRACVQPHLAVPHPARPRRRLGATCPPSTEQDGRALDAKSTRRVNQSQLHQEQQKLVTWRDYVKRTGNSPVGGKTAEQAIKDQEDLVRKLHQLQSDLQSKLPSGPTKYEPPTDRN
jgi:hypothetical protein